MSGLMLFRAAVAGLAAVALATAEPGGPAAGAVAAPALTPVRVIGGHGHAGLYGWGVAAAGNTMLVGDYFNYRVTQWNLDGTPAGDGVLLGNRGFGPTQNQTIYGIAVDPGTGFVFTGEADRQLVTMYDSAGNFLKRWGGNGAGRDRFLYPSRIAISSLGIVYVADTWDNNIVAHLVSRTAPYAVTELFQFGSFGTGDGQFKQPHGMAFDAQDNLYVADNGNKRVVVFGTDGRFIRSFGAGTFTGDLRGLTIDKDNGWVYVVDAAANRVNKYRLDGTLITRWGTPGTGTGQFLDGGREIAVDADHNVWVGDMPNFRAQKFSPTGQFLDVVPDPPAPPPNGGFNGPRGAAVGPDGSVFVTDTYNWRIQKFDPAGAFVKAWGRRGRGDFAFNYARMIATDRRTGDVVIVDSDNHQIKKYSADAVFLDRIGGPVGSGPGLFRNPQGVDVDANGFIYVADSRNQRVQVFTPGGDFVRQFGTKGTGPGQFGYPRGVTVDPADGDIYVADLILDRVTRFSSTGAVRNIVYGGTGTSEASLDRPFDVAIAGSLLYVADTSHHKIKVYDTATGALVGSHGGKGTTLGRFDQPQGLDIHNGQLYVTEQGNERVQVLDL